MERLSWELANKALDDPTRPCLAIIGYRNDHYFVAVFDAEGGLETPRLIHDKQTAQACFNLIDTYFPGMTVKVDIDHRQTQLVKVDEPRVHLPGPKNSKVRHLLEMLMNWGPPPSDHLELEYEKPPAGYLGAGPNPYDEEFKAQFKKDYDPDLKMLKPREDRLLRPGNYESDNPHIVHNDEGWFWHDEKGQGHGPYPTFDMAKTRFTKYCASFDPFAINLPAPKQFPSITGGDSKGPDVPKQNETTENKPQ
jgi:hypothetical protein